MKRLFYAIFALMPLCAAAQDVQDAPAPVEEQEVAAPAPRFGVLSYESLLTSMPQYAAAIASAESVREAYDKEMARSESEFQRKFAEFLQGQKDFPLNIMQKRQKELQQLMEQGVAFRQEVQKLLAQAREDALRPVRAQLDAAIKAVGAEHALSFIFNVDGGTLPFIGGTGEVIDVTPLVQAKLQEGEAAE